MVNRLSDLRGHAYVEALTEILNSSEGQVIIDEANECRAKRSGGFLVRDVLEIAVNHSLPLKAVCEWLEGRGALPHGAYRRLIDRGFKIREGIRLLQEERAHAVK